MKKRNEEVPGRSSSRSSSGNRVDAKPEANVAPVERLLYGREEAAYKLSISLRRVDYGLALGEFETRRVGKRVLITAPSLKRWASKDHYRPVSKTQPAGLDQEDKAA